MFSRILALLIVGSFSLFLVRPANAAPTKEEVEVSKYSNMLKVAKTPKDRITALKELGRLGAIQVSLVRPLMPEIVKCLDNSDAKVRAEAAITVGKCDPDKKEEIVKKLVKMLKDDKEEVVKHGAAEGLAAMGPDSKEAVPALREEMKKAGKKGGRVYQNALMSITGRKK